MSGALIQLVSKGVQDVYLTSEEGHSFFRTKFSRHTNFSQAPKLIKDITNTDNSITIPVYGDIINGLWFQGTGESNISSNLFYNSTIDLYIGGQKVDSHHYDYYSDIWPNYLAGTYTKSQEINTKANIGNIAFVPLHFFFCDGGTVLPLVALQNHTVEIRVNFDDTQYNAAGPTPAQKKITLYGNYIYLDTDEREAIIKRQLDMVITQVQRVEFPIDFSASNYNSLDISQFNHPVKSLFFGFSTSGSDYINDRFSFDTCDIHLNGTPLLESMNPMYFHTIENYFKSKFGQIVYDPVNKAMLYTRFYTTHFCLNASEYSPTGTCNFSRLDNAKLIIRNAVRGINRTDETIFVYAVNYNILRIKDGMAGILFGN
jgi:hypothetical protein